MSEIPSSDLQSQRDRHIGRYLLELNHSFVAATLAHMAENGFESITPHHIRIITQIDAQGTPVSEVLRRSGVTKQSLSNTLGVLESNGFIQRVASQGDARSKCVQFTKKGMNLLQAGMAAVNEVETQYAEVLGEKRFQQVKAALGELHQAVASE